MYAGGYVSEPPASKVTSQTPPPHECQKLILTTSLMNIKKDNAIENSTINSNSNKAIILMNVKNKSAI